VSDWQFAKLRNVSTFSRSPHDRTAAGRRPLPEGLVFDKESNSAGSRGGSRLPLGPLALHLPAKGGNLATCANGKPKIIRRHLMNRMRTLMYSDTGQRSTPLWRLSSLRVLG
jgi:hypothetical protein